MRMGTVAQTCDPSPWETEARRPGVKAGLNYKVRWRLAWTTWDPVRIKQNKNHKPVMNIDIICSVFCLDERKQQVPHCFAHSPALTLAFKFTLFLAFLSSPTSLYYLLSMWEGAVFSLEIQVNSCSKDPKSLMGHKSWLFLSSPTFLEVHLRCSGRPGAKTTLRLCTWDKKKRYEFVSLHSELAKMSAVLSIYFPWVSWSLFRLVLRLWGKIGNFIQWKHAFIFLYNY